MAEKSSATKTTSQSTPKKKPAKKTAKKASSPRAEKPRGTSGPQIARGAARQLAELTGKDVEGVTGLQRGEDGWEVEVEVTELRRVPTTTDVMATYLIDVDGSGDLQGYRRTGRYVRGQAEGES